MMGHADVEAGNGRIAVKRVLDPTRRVFAEHEVAAIGERESLFVLTLDGRLDGRPQRLFDAIKQRDQR